MFANWSNQEGVCVCVCVSERQGKRAKMVVIEKESQDGQHDLLEDYVMECLSVGKAWKVWHGLKTLQRPVAAIQTAVPLLGMDNR